MDSYLLRRALPSAVTLLRLAAAPVFFLVFLHCSCVLAFVVFVLAALTDVLDGFIARRLGVASNAGAYFDATVDFILVSVVFIAFFLKVWYDWFVLVLILALFIGFVVSSGLKRPLYDPIGKYTGTFLMAMIVLSLLLPYPFVRKILTIFLALFCVLSITGRLVFLYRRKAGHLKS